MIKIAFCDDDMEVLHQMNELLDRYRVERNEDITYAAFQSPFELLTEIEKGIRPDILFLDVVMPGQNGMDVAKEIRQYDTNMKIIFLTSSPEFAVESYSVGAYFYQLKPIWEESFFRLMDAVLGRKLLFHLENGAVLESAGSLDDLAGQLMNSKVTTVTVKYQEITGRHPNGGGIPIYASNTPDNPKPNSDDKPLGTTRGDGSFRVVFKDTPPPYLYFYGDKKSYKIDSTTTEIVF